MIAYFDTSAVVPLLIEEPHSATVGSIWARSDRVASVRLLYPEGRAALARAHRLGRIGVQELRQAATELDRIFSQLDIVEVGAQLAHRAGELAEDLGLRVYDAVHLASAEAISGKDMVLVAADRALCSAAEVVGINVASF